MGKRSRRRKRIKRARPRPISSPPLDPEPVDQWFVSRDGRGCGQCGRPFRFRFRRGDAGEIWDLFIFDPQLGDWIIAEDKICPTCGKSFAGFDATAIKEAFAESMARL